MADLAQLLTTAFSAVQSGRLDEAESICRRILQQRPQEFDALHILGVIALHRKDYLQAVARLTAAIATGVKHAQAFSNLGVALGRLGRFAEALAQYDAAIQITPNHADAHNNRGNALRQLGRREEALAAFDQAVKLRPDYAEAYTNRGMTLHELKRYEEALLDFERALHLQPRSATAYANRGNVLRDLKRFPDAIASYDTALQLQPQYSHAFANRCITLVEMGKLEEGLAGIRQALARQPNSGELLTNLGFALCAAARMEESIAVYRRALELEPELPTAHWNLGLAELLRGNLSAGWPGYEYRWQVTGFQYSRPKLPFPVWQGETLLGKSIVVYAEQGWGDSFQFCRYLLLLRERGSRVAFLVPERLHRLLQSLSPEIELLNEWDGKRGFDFQCALLSLPLRFQTTLTTIPRPTAYLTAEPERMAHWRQIIGKRGLKIGIAWQGNPKSPAEAGRSIPLRMFAPLAMPGVRLISLQKYDGLEQLADLPAGMQVDTLGEDFDAGRDAFVDTAAVMKNLDLIVTSDTSLAHLAGALGCPTWVVLKDVPDWRWLLERDDSPWYPTLRLFRQRERGNWREVFARVAAEVQKIRPQPSSGKPLPPQLSQRLTAGIAAHQAGRFDEATDVYQQILAHSPENFDALHLTGVICLQRGEYAAALRFLQAALEVEPQNFLAYCSLGTAYHKLAKLPEAIAAYERAIALQPTDAESHSNLGNVLRDLKRHEEALEHYRIAVRLKPDFADGYYNQGNVLRDLNRLEEAVKSYSFGLQLLPLHGPMTIALANAEADLGNFADAEKLLTQVLVREPTSPSALWNRGLLRLRRAELAAGWRDYEERWNAAESAGRKPAIPWPVWQGESLSAKSILVYAEQGIGDEIMFASCIPDLIAQAERVYVTCEPRLVPIYRRSFPSAELINSHDLPDWLAGAPRIDYQIAAGSLPRYFRTQLTDFPQRENYLQADATARTTWRERLAKFPVKRHVGISWRGGNKSLTILARSTRLEQWRDLLRTPHIHFVNLQYGDVTKELQILREQSEIAISQFPEIDPLKDMDSFAALISALDLVISIDNSTVHVAGALGVPTWALLPHVAEWRWFLDRTDSPWYRSVRLFRQPQRGNWEELFANVQRELASR